jgi:hypothetical protein
MDVIVALISILVLGAIIAVLLFKKPQSSLQWILLWVYGSNFIFEVAMFVTSKMGLHNHFLLNIHTLLLGSGMFLLIVVIWKRLLVRRFSQNFLGIVLVVFTVVWALDNFILHDFFIFNPLNQAIIFMVNLCLVIYLLNVLLFMRKVGPNVNVDKFLIFAFLVHCFACVVIDSFLNYYIVLPESLYLLVSVMGQVLALVAHFFVLLAVIWLVKTRKYISL